MTALPAASVLTTPRLLLRPLELADAPEIQRLFPHWEIVRYLVNRLPWPYPPDGALIHVRDRVLPAMARREEWHWSLRLREKPEALIGTISLMLGEDDNRGFWIAPAFQGRGLMGEACEAVTAFWFETLGQAVLRVPKAAANLPSRRISESAGMRLVGTTTRDYVGGPGLTVLWEITRSEWLALRPHSG